jgi:hypothetical protein
VGIGLALAVLAELWDEVERLVGQSAWADIVQAAARFADAPDEVARRAAAFNLIERLSVALPPDHPVLAALAGEDTRLSSPGSADYALVAAALGRRIATPTPDDRAAQPPSQSEPHQLPAAPSADEVASGAQSRLLNLPCVTAGWLRMRGHDPRTRDLIRLGADGALPAFQFDADGAPRPIVLAVNRLIDADDDPWGAADWWTGANAWLEAAPADLIGHVQDDVLVAAAEALVGEV